MDANKKAVRDAIKAFRDNVIIDEVDRTAAFLCEGILRQASLFRQNAEGAHEFTGNLLNSIVTGYYLDGELRDFFTTERIGVKPSRYHKMTASHGVYFFKYDYRGRRSFYRPTVETDGGKGAEDAIRFITSYKPQYRKGFEIVVAYTTEYATWVENQRKTTGFMNTRAWAKKACTVNFFQVN